MAIPSTRQLATIRSEGGFEYQITRSDVLWMARMAAFEGGHAADSLWALTQRLVWFDEEKSVLYSSLGALAQDFSQPINPKWTVNGEFCVPGGKYHGTSYCTTAKFARRQEARESTLEELANKDPEAVAMTVAWSQGLLGNPVPTATNWAAPGVSERYLDRNPEAELLTKRGNWFIIEKEARKWPENYVFMQSPTGAIADASGVFGRGGAESFARGAAQSLTNWWRIG